MADSEHHNHQAAAGASHPAQPDGGRPRPLPSPPFVNVPGIANLRDMGGYESSSHVGKKVASGVVFRSGDLSEAGDEAAAVLRGLRIAQVFDLRSVPELKHVPVNHTDVIEVAGAQLVFAPVFQDQDYSPEALASRFQSYGDGAEGFVHAYKSILTAAASSDNPHTPYKRILEHLAVSPGPPSPILVHCTAGKDRTGLICAIILALCGVDDEIIAHEYSLTELGFAPRKEATIQRLIQHEGLDRFRAERMVSARKEIMLTTLGMIRETYGSVEGYVVDHCRVSFETIEQLRRNLLVDLAAGGGAIDWRRHASLLS